MFSSEDKLQIEQEQIKISELEKQINYFKTDFPSLVLDRPATLSEGILALNDTQESHSKPKKTAFIPSSGAATRMFQEVFSYSENEQETPTMARLFSSIHNLPLLQFLPKNSSKKQTIKYLIDNFSNLPKGLLPFHRYKNEYRTAFEEHWVEGLEWIENQTITLHFTISSEHKNHFERLTQELLHKFSNFTFDIQFSEQKKSTQTIAVTTDNEPFRYNNRLIFRPSGHGALVENLAEISSDCVFIKNIDNVSPNKQKTGEAKNKLTQHLFAIRTEMSQNLAQIMTHFSEEVSQKMIGFLQKLGTIVPLDFKLQSLENQKAYFIQKLNRPIRVCGMVKNQGAPGGGPFWVKQQDGSISLQIVESAQVSPSHSQQSIFKNSTHFNPVFLVCNFRDFDNKPYDLKQFRDENTGFITQKSMNGKPLKALELPGLWNGSMSDWNTIFVEIPLETFTPAKTVFDLIGRSY